MINTFCKFYYGHTVDETNYALDFKEGAGSELNANVEIGEYTLTDFASAVSNALNETGALTYTVSVNRTTRIITISASGSFTLLASTGSRVGIGIWSLLGFSVNTSSASSHAGTIASGSEWIPQFKPQDFVDFQDQQSSVDGVKRESANGSVEAISFGNRQIMDANFTFITDIGQSSNAVITNDASGVSNARTFLEYATTKADLEFIPDKNSPSTFTKCILESTSESKDGLGFKLKELYARGLPGYYETGVLKFRKVT